MGQLGPGALDGMKIAASASKDASRSAARLRELAGQIAAKHAAADAAEDALSGPGVRGAGLPAGLAGPRTRSGRIAAALAELDAERRGADEARDRRDAQAEACLAGPGTRGRPPAAARVAAARARLERAVAGQQARQEAWQDRVAAAAAAGRGRHGKPPAPPEHGGTVARARAAPDKTLAAAQAGPAGSGRSRQSAVRNLTDPHSRLMPVRGGGFIQGYNTQNVTSSDGLIIATQLTAGPAGNPWFEPMLHRAGKAAALITAARPDGTGREQTGLLLADAGYLSARNLTAPGPGRLIATGKRRDLDKQAAGRHRAAPADPAIAAMAARLATPDGITSHRHRGHIAETPHGHIKHNTGSRQLSVRGKPRATAEWNLVCTARNLLKAISTGTLTAAALASLPTQPA